MHVRTATHKVTNKVCTICHKEFQGERDLLRHYCTKAMASFDDDNNYDTYTLETLDSEMNKCTKYMSKYERFLLFSERKVAIPGKFPLLAVPRAHKHLNFQLFGDRDANTSYKRILKEKILRGDGNSLIVPKNIKLVDGEGNTKFLLSEDVLAPTSRKILVEEHDQHHLKLSLIKPPRAKGRPSISRFLRESLEKLKSFMDFSKKMGFEFDPHE